jgi:hypothetical protein
MRIRETDIVIQRLPFRETKRQKDCKDQHYKSHTINRAIERNPGATIKQLSLQTKLPVSKIIEHVEWFLGLKRPKLAISRKYFSHYLIDQCPFLNHRHAKTYGKPRVCRNTHVP